MRQVVVDSRSTVLVAKLRPGVLWRFTATVALRVDSPAVLGRRAASRNSLRSLRSLRSDNRDESDYEVRCAHSPAPCAPRRRRGAPQPTRAQLRRRVVGICCNEYQPHHFVAAGGTGRGRFLWRRGAQHQDRRARRASSTFSSRLFERRERSEQSEFRDATLVRAPQRSRREARPPQVEPSPDTACRDASNCAGKCCPQ